VRRVNAVLQHPDPDKHFMLANLDYAVVGMKKYKYWNVKPQENMGPNCGEMVCRYTCCVRYNINWRDRQAAHICVLICGHETESLKSPVQNR
jgi:predicted phage-related endonuclease